IDVTFQGFQAVTTKGVVVDVGAEVVQNFSLRPGSVTQTVEVTATAPLLESQDASVGQVVDSSSVNNLPLNGRNFTFLAQLSAGVNSPPADTRGNAASGAFSANGLRPAQNNYLLDGIDNNSNTVDFLNGTNFVVLPPLDAIQEFKVQTSDYSAQFGRAGGAILSATIGGPILKNKVFFFGDYEGVRKRQGTVFTSTVPTVTERNSGFTDLSQIITGQTGTQSDLLNRLFPIGTVFDPATTRAITCGAADPVSGITPVSASKGDPCFPIQTTAGTSVGYARDPIFATSQTLTGVTNFTTAAWAGLLNHLPAGRLDANAIKLLSLFPTPTNNAFSSNYADSPVGDEHRNAFDVRMDLNRGDKDQIFARFSYIDDPQFIPGPFGGIA